MRIALVIHSMHAGGAERITSHLANAWAERGWTVTLITIASESLDFYALHPSVTRRALELAGESNGVLAALVANVRRVLALRRAIRECKPDVVIGMMATAAVLSILAAQGLGCRVIASERTHPPMLPIGRLWHALRRYTYPRAYRVTMLTQDGLRWLQTTIPNANGVVIPNPVPYPLPVNAPLLQPESYIEQHRKLLLAVGRMDEGKQFDRLISAFSAIAAKYADWNLAILGSGSVHPRLVQQITNLGLEARVTLPGRVGNIGDWYARADLYAMSSRFEGFPNTLAEAMAHGCAAVSFDCDTGPRDIILDGENGLLVRPVGDIHAFTCALEKLMGDELLRDELSEQAVNVRVRFSLPNILQLWDAILVANTH
jgi:glycosyltransferase involved in cell wall biosynthesis